MASRKPLLSRKKKEDEDEDEGCCSCWAGLFRSSEEKALTPYRAKNKDIVKRQAERKKAMDDRQAEAAQKRLSR